MIGHAARKLLEADHPLSLKEIFPNDGLQYGKKLSKTYQRNFLDRLVQNNTVTTRKDASVVRYEARDRQMLNDLAASCPPDVQEEPMPIKMSLIPRGSYGYNKKEWERFARFTVAKRALKRLMAAETNVDTSRCQPKTTLFIAQKGDKHQQKQVLDKRWQEDFLEELEKTGAVRSSDEQGVTIYSIENKKVVQELIDDKRKPCIHDLLWPAEPCPIDHAKLTAEAEAKAAESSPELETTPENEPVQAPQEKTEEVTVISVPLSEVEDVKPEPDPAIVHENIPADISTKEALGAICDLVTNLSQNVIALSKSTSTGSQLIVKMHYEIEQLHTKVDKLHDENVQLRKEQDKAKVILDSVEAATVELFKMISPEDSSINAIRKRLNEIEKLATSHKEQLELGNKLLKSSLADAANAMVTEAAKVFVKEDHSVVLTRMTELEENIEFVQSGMTKTLEQVFGALEQVRAEYKNTNRIPVILERMSTIAEELKNLQTLFS